MINEGPSKFRNGTEYKSLGEHEGIQNGNSIFLDGTKEYCIILLKRCNLHHLNNISPFSSFRRITVYCVAFCQNMLQNAGPG